MQWGLQMMKRMNESDGKSVKKKSKKDCVDDNDEEEELIPRTFSDISGEDDGQVRICWDLRDGRLRPYNGKLEDFWSKQPKVVHPIRESYLDSHLRLDPVNPLVTLRDHDRGARRTIKQYSKSNFRVVKSTATIRSVGLDTNDVGLTKDYEECTGAYQLMSAFWQYTLNLFLVRRDDYSGLVILKVLHDVKYFQPVLMSKVVGKKQRDAKQVEVMNRFIDDALERNSMMGKQGRPPLTYEELLKIARSAANLIYAGSGVGLDWGVDTGTCGVDPYTLGDGFSSEPREPVGNPPRAKNLNRGGGGQGAGGQGRSGVAGGGRVDGSGGNAGNGGGGANRGTQWCKDWNRGACRWTYACLLVFFYLRRFLRFPNACNYIHRCNKQLQDGTLCDRGHKSRDHK